MPALTAIPETPQSALQRLILTVVEKGVGPLTGSVDYAHARLRDDKHNRVPAPPGDSMQASYPAAGSAEAERVIARIIAESTAAAGVNGFVTGLGGFVVLPVSLPANIAGTLIINARMVGSVAYLRGYQLSDPHTQAMLMLVVAGTSAQKAASLLGLKVGQELTKAIIKKIPIAVIRKINERVGFMLLAKWGTKRSVVTLAKGIPVAGGFVGGGVDAILTRAIGEISKKAFPA